MPRTLVIIAGPTGVGKTDYAIELALRLGSPIINCDSRQIYKEMSIGTAVPDASQLAAVRHYFVQTVSVMEDYTAGQYGRDALALIEELFAQGHETLVMCGGSGFYIDAVCKGFGDTPPSDPVLRGELSARAAEGLAPLLEELHRLDPACYRVIDRTNPRRVVRALEVCLLSGRPFSSFKLSAPKKRDFEIEKYCLTRPREELYSRIDARVTKMMDEGLLDEVRSLLPYRARPALQTVGYKELFEYLDSSEELVSSRTDDSSEHQGRISGCAGGVGEGSCPARRFSYRGGALPRPQAPSHSLDEAVALIQQHTRNYAKRQLTWWRRDKEVRWIDL